MNEAAKLLVNKDFPVFILHKYVHGMSTFVYINVYSTIT